MSNNQDQGKNGFHPSELECKRMVRAKGKLSQTTYSCASENLYALFETLVLLMHNNKLI